jgi:hypothetical protein
MRRRVEVLAKRILQGGGGGSRSGVEAEDDGGHGDQHPPSEQEGGGGGKDREKASKSKVRAHVPCARVVLDRRVMGCVCAESDS